MNLHCIKWSKFTYNNNDIDITREIDTEINPYSHSIECRFKKFGTIDKEGLKNLLKRLNFV